jgi:hypothetical protein
MGAHQNPKKENKRARSLPPRQEKNPHLDGAHYRRQAEQDQRPTEITDALSTDISIALAWKNWEQYSECIEHPDLLEMMKNVTVQQIRSFMHWYLDKHNVKKSDAFYVKMRFWRIAIARKLLRQLDEEQAEWNSPDGIGVRIPSMPKAHGCGAFVVLGVL